MIRLKSPGDIEKMRAAGKILRSALDEAGKKIAPGLKTSELDEIVRKAIEDAGARPAFKGYLGFPGNSCISLNRSPSTSPWIRRVSTSSSGSPGRRRRSATKPRK